MYNLPNILTLSRIAVIPLIFATVYINSYAWSLFAAVLFVAASVTDYLDGYLARARHETSAFGRLLDPIADKLLVASALVVILVKGNPGDLEGLSFWKLSAWGLTVLAAFVILCREILVSGLREFLREVNVGLPVTRLAKWKTGFQMTALSLMLFEKLWHGWYCLGEVLLWVAATLTFITGYQYYQKSLDYVKAEEAKNKAQKKEAEPVKKTRGRPKVSAANAKAAGKAEEKTSARGRKPATGTEKKKAGRPRRGKKAAAATVTGEEAVK